MGKVVTLGEIMLRFSTETGIRIPQAESFSIHYGGGEANVAISLANYGHQVLFASKVPANGLGEAVKKHLNRFGVDTRHLLFGGDRLGTYYLESGVGERAANVIYDRAGSSFAAMEQLEWNLESLFNGVDIFHISGITPALSEKWRALALDIVQMAKKSGCKISFDVNYRSKLWSPEQAGKFLTQILPYVDYCSAGSLDAQKLLEIPSYSGTGRKEEMTYYYQAMQKRYPNISVFYSTNRTVNSASVNQLIGTMWAERNFYESQCHMIDPIVDRVGGGDAFAGGVLHSLLNKDTYSKAICFATAAAALKHTVYGDSNQFNQQEVENFLYFGSGKIVR
ncbi:PfkB family carbohydrate kinase [Enterococcus sp. AZ196]|uniref:PfkB family carbohydrate kinase n=1 Tax=Enterococcus sp. AZ196 TaxID=2774659 RepID=UPI003D279F3C